MDSYSIMSKRAETPTSARFLCSKYMTLNCSLWKTSVRTSQVLQLSSRTSFLKLHTHHPMELRKEVARSDEEWAQVQSDHPRELHTPQVTVPT